MCAAALWYGVAATVEVLVARVFWLSAFPLCRKKEKCIHTHVEPTLPYLTAKYTIISQEADTHKVRMNIKKHQNISISAPLGVTMVSLQYYHNSYYTSLQSPDVYGQLGMTMHMCLHPPCY